MPQLANTQPSPAVSAPGADAADIAAVCGPTAKHAWMGDFIQLVDQLAGQVAKGERLTMGVMIDTSGGPPKSRGLRFRRRGWARMLSP